MYETFSLPKHLSGTFEGQGEIYLTLEPLEKCSCGGKVHIHSSVLKRVVHIIMTPGCIYLKYNYRSYRCKVCRKITYDDYKLGVSHKTTSHYRTYAVMIAEQTSFGRTASLLSVPKSTLYNWAYKKNSIHANKNKLN